MNKKASETFQVERLIMEAASQVSGTRVPGLGCATTWAVGRGPICAASGSQEEAEVLTGPQSGQ